MAEGDRRGAAIRLSIRDAELVRAALEELGAKGADALKRIERAGHEAAPGLKALDTASREVQGTMAGLAGRLGPVGTVLTALGPIGIAAAAGLGALTLGAKAAIGAWGEYEQRVKRVEGVLRATGGAAGLTSGQIVALAERIEKSTLQSAEGALEAAAALATFGSVSGESFERALKVSADLAAVMRTDVASAARQVGRAAEGGLDALTRAGVVFTAASKEQVEALVETGDAAKVVDVVLTALEGKVGGAAATERTGLSGALKGLGDAWGDLLKKWGETIERSPAVIGAINAAAAAANAGTELLGGTPEQRFRSLAGQLAAAETRLSGARAAGAARVDPLGALYGTRGTQGTAEAEAEVARLRHELLLLDQAMEEELDTRGRLQVAAEKAAAARAEEAKTTAHNEAAEKLIKKAKKDSAKAEDELAKAIEEGESRLNDARNARIDAARALKESVAAIAAEAEALGKSERERAIANELLRHEGELMKLSAEEREKYVAQLRRAAEAREDAREAAEKLKKAEREAEAEAKRAAEMAMEPWKNALRGIQGAFTGFFEDVLSGGVRTFSDLASAAKAIFIRLAAELASLWIFRPVTGAVLGGLGLGGTAGPLGLGAFTGGAGVGGAAGAGGGGSAGFSLAQLGGTLVGGLQSPALGGLGVSLGGSLGLGATGQAMLGNAFLNAPMGGIGAILASIMGLGSGGIGGMALGAAGGLAGGALGAQLGAFGGPLGALAGGFIGTALSGLFGKSAGNPSADTRLTFDALTGAAGRGASFAGGGNVSATEAMAEAAAKILNQFASSLGARISGVLGTGSSILANFGEFRGEFHGSVHGGADLAFGGAEEAVKSVVLRILKRPELFEGVSESIATVMRESTAATVEELIEAVNRAAAIDRFIADLTDNVARLTSGLSEFGAVVNPAAQALAAVNAEFDRLAAEARALGLDTGQIETARGLATTALTAGFDRQVQDLVLALTDPDGKAMQDLEALQAARLDAAAELGADLVEVERLNMLERRKLVEEQGAAERATIEQTASAYRRLGETLEAAILGLKVGELSALAPADRLAVARTAFASTEAAARTGDAAALGALPGAAQALLTAARSFHASSPDYAAEFARVIAALEEMRALSEARGAAPGFASGGVASGWAWTGERGPELAYFASPAAVFSAEQSRRLLDRAANDNRDIIEALRQQTGVLSEGLAEVSRRLSAVERSVRQETQARLFARG